MECPRIGILSGICFGCGPERKEPSSNHCFASLLLTGCALAQAGSPDAVVQEAKLVVFEHLWNDAQIHRDSHALEALIADGFVNTEYDGEVSERDKFLADIKNPEFKPSAMKIRDVKVNVYRGYGRSHRELSR